MLKILNLNWAYPIGTRQVLLIAAAGEDEQIGLSLFEKWVSENNIDDLEFAEQRLLLPIITRYGDKLNSLVEYPRLIGLQRLMWSRAKLSFHQNLEFLKFLGNEGVEFALVKGAAVNLLPYSSILERISHDVDIIVALKDFKKTVNSLRNCGWLPSSGVSHQYLCSVSESVRSVNLFKGDLGDLDIHTQPFHFGQGNTNDDLDFWQRTKSKDLEGVELKLPSPEDIIVMAIAHGGYDGHTHSDWMVDCTRILRHEKIDWNLLFELIIARSVQVSAVVTFSFFKEILKINVDPLFFDNLLLAVRKTDTLKYYIDMIQVRPKANFGKFGQLIRFLAKNARKKNAKHASPVSSNQRGSNIRAVVRSSSEKQQPKHPKYVNQISAPARGCALRFSATLLTEPTIGPRRICFEMNTQNHHITNFVVKKYSKKRLSVRVFVEGVIELPETNETCYIEARPSKQLREDASETLKSRYDAVKFEIENIDLKVK